MGANASQAHAGRGPQPANMPEVVQAVMAGATVLAGQVEENLRQSHANLQQQATQLQQQHRLHGSSPLLHAGSSQFARRGSAGQDRLQLQLRAYSAYTPVGDGDGINPFEGTQVRLPAPLVARLVAENPDGEHFYRVQTQEDCFAFVGVKDYSSPLDSACVLPHSMMEQLGLMDGGSVELTLVNATPTQHQTLIPLPLATRLRLRWEHAQQYDAARALPESEAFDLQAALEKAVDEDYPVIMLNDVVTFHYGGAAMELRVTGLHKRPPLQSTHQAQMDFTDEEAQIRRAISESLAEASVADAAAPGEPVRMRVPQWHAFERQLEVESPLGWKPPPPFPDAMWDEERQMYYPAGWQWDEAAGTYVAPSSAAPVAAPRTQAARSRLQEGAGGGSIVANSPPNFGPGAGQALGGDSQVVTHAATASGAAGDPTTLSKEELRRKRIQAMERRSCETSGSPISMGSLPRPASGANGAASQRSSTSHGAVGVCQSMQDLELRTINVDGKQGWEARRNISVEVHESTIRRHFDGFASSGWACTWSILYGTILLEHDRQTNADATVPKVTVRVQALWKPPQHEADAEYTGNGQGLGRPPQLLRSPAAFSKVEAAVAAAGLRTVGWLFTCPPRASDFSLRAEEVLRAAYLQLEAADGYAEGEPPFVTLRMSVEPQASLSTVGSKAEAPRCELTAWCATAQAMELRAKGALETTGTAEHHDAIRVAQGFRVLQEGRPVDHVDISFLHRPLPMAGSFGHTSSTEPLDLAAVAATASEGAQSELEEEQPQVTRWAPPELRKPTATFLGQGARLGGSEFGGSRLVPDTGPTSLVSI
mmetsp:Transcript_31971/g.62903  ORF Transcript_31971/g.62903 Transcript_31971/m.62903 type:complete len:823 (+) Transcript_31971:103-2571(+)